MLDQSGVAPSARVAYSAVAVAYGVWAVAYSVWDVYSAWAADSGAAERAWQVGHLRELLEVN